MSNLTKKQKQVYDFIINYIDQMGHAPTQMEIKEHFGFKSLGSVQDYLQYLKNSGHIQNNPNSVRGLVPVQKKEQHNIIEIPLHGKVAAGSPIEAMETQEHIEVPAAMLGAGVHFALTVSGDSMIEDGIFDGDLILVKKQNTANIGETVVALIDGHATVKKFYKEKNAIVLQPANHTLKPIIIQDGNFAIQGKVVGLLRKY